ncbi:MAG: Ig-like domain-containing protein [Chloroflexi bacterium]|nr:Ig-like domain-containing protein [Chloroflexota bacterium]
MKGLVPLLIFVMVSFAACSTSRSSTPTAVRSAAPPQVSINSPTNGTQLTTGTEVVVQSTSADSDGILRVDLLVDGQVVRSDTDPTGRPKQYRISQTWNATTPGSHLMVVRAINNKGVPGEASLQVTVIDAPTPTNTATPTPRPSATLTPTSAASSASATSPPAPPTLAPTPTRPPATIQYSISLNEAQVGAMINQIIAASNQNDVSITGVSLQNGQIIANTSVKGPFGVLLTGRVVVAVTAAKCDVQATITEATAGPLSLTETQKADWDRAIEELIRKQIAAAHSYTCIDSITIANGTMTIKFH